MFSLKEKLGSLVVRKKTKEISGGWMHWYDQLVVVHMTGIRLDNMNGIIAFEF